MDNQDENLKIEQAKSILNNFNIQLKNKFDLAKDISYNANTKGAYFEKAVHSMLDDYLGSRFDLYQRGQLIDARMEYIKIFPTGANEIDIIATFKNAFPRIILRLDDAYFVPYDATAFNVEVKAYMNKSTLNKTMQKFERINQLFVSPNRFGGIEYGSNYSIMRPLRVAFFLELDIDRKTMEDLLQQHCHVWDIIFVDQNNEVFLNKSLPIVELLYKLLAPEKHSTDKFMTWGDYPFVIFLLVISNTIQKPVSVDVINTFINIAALAFKNKSN